MTAETLRTITVIVPARNEEKSIEKCLISLINQDFPKDYVEILVIDNESTDATSIIASKIEGIHVISAPNLNVGAVRNLGASKANGEILVFIDADCTAPFDWLKKINNGLLEPKTVLGGGILLPQNPKPIEKFWLLEGPDGPSLPKELIGASIALSKTDFVNIGGFDEKITSGEDSELSIRFKKNGYKITILRDFSVVHLGNAKTSIEFIKRQIWHSENYFKKKAGLFKDPVFILTLMFTIALYINVYFLITYSSNFWNLILQLIIPLPLTLKRIARAKFQNRKIAHLIIIFYIDLIYLVGRTIGAHKSIFNQTIFYAKFKRVYSK